jgi:uncharacterized protein YecA (UPF0149 family)
VELFGSISTEVEHNRFQLGVTADTPSGVFMLADWCDGFLLGHQYLEDVWSAALDELDDDQLFEQIDETLDCAIAFAAGDAVDWDEDIEFALTEFIRFQQLLEDYRDIHTRCRYDRTGLSVEQVFLEMKAVSANTECPCGSGRLFKDCCLH